MGMRGMLYIKTGGVLFLNCEVSEVCFFLLGGVLAGYWRGISIVEDLTCQYMKFVIISVSKAISPRLYLFI